jgi:hypothetical protein
VMSPPAQCHNRRRESLPGRLRALRIEMLRCFHKPYEISILYPKYAY